MVETVQVLTVVGVMAAGGGGGDGGGGRAEVMAAVGMEAGRRRR